jgi:hypothetical protein
VKGFHKQKGTVLIIAMLFLALVSIAGFSSLNNLQALGKSQSVQISRYQGFYKTEQQLLKIEKQFLEKTFSEAATNSFLKSENIANSESQLLSVPPEVLYEKYKSFLKFEEGTSYLVEYLGKHIEIPAAELDSQTQDINYCLFRITFFNADAQSSSLQSWLKLYPNESRLALELLGENSRSKRLAWFAHPS